MDKRPDVPLHVVYDVVKNRIGLYTIELMVDLVCYFLAKMLILHGDIVLYGNWNNWHQHIMTIATGADH